MLCKKPYMKGLLAFGCGQCLPCSINKRRLWAHRIVLESYMHKKSCFLTLTYDEKHLPQGGTLVPKHYQNFLKRLRRAIAPNKIRYFFVGEYGDDTERPHYHAALYGLGPEDSEIINNCWGHGFIYVGDITPDSASYLSGYVTKKMSHPESQCTDRCTHPKLRGRHPEFSRPSLKPGIGAKSMETINNTLLTDQGAHLIIQQGDVPLQLQHGKKKMPLGRYLRKELRKLYGFENTGAQDGWQNKKKGEMQTLLEEAGIPKNAQRTVDKALVLEKHNSQKILNLETKFKIFNKKGSI